MICTLTRYREITNDFDNFDGDVRQSLVAAQRLVERKTDRHFDLRDEDGELIERTESLKMHRNWLVYPKALPVHSVLSPTDAEYSSTAIYGTDISYPSWFSQWGYIGTVTYVGGYELEDMPEDIVQAVAELAYSFLKAGEESNIPVGATSVHVGDVSFAGKNLGAQGVSDSVSKTIQLWKRREV